MAKLKMNPSHSQSGNIDNSKSINYLESKTNIGTSLIVSLCFLLIGLVYAYILYTGLTRTDTTDSWKTEPFTIVSIETV